MSENLKIMAQMAEKSMLCAIQQSFLPIFDNPRQTWPRSRTLNFFHYALQKLEQKTKQEIVLLDIGTV